MGLSIQRETLGERDGGSMAQGVQLSEPHDKCIRHSDEVLSCALLFPLSALKAPKITSAVLHSAEPLVEKLAQFYNVPVPRVELIEPLPWCRMGAWYSPREHVIGLTSDNMARQLPGLVFHEFNHIWQFKAIIAAQLVDPTVYNLLGEISQEFFEPLVEAVRSQRLAENSAFTTLGRKLAISHVELCRARQIESRTMDIDEYLEMREVYRRSLLELLANIPEIDVNVWLNERDLAESSREVQRLHEERLMLPAWSLLAAAGNRFATWVAERRCIKLIREIQVLVDELRAKVDEAVDRIGGELDDARWSGGRQFHEQAKHDSEGAPDFSIG